MKRVTRYLLLFLLIAKFFSCGNNPTTPDYQKEIAVFGFLWGNKPLTADRAIMITYTQPIDKFYDLDQAVISNASVTITETSTGNAYTLADNDKAGFYFNDSFIPKYRTEYLLKIEVDNRTVTATTMVPPQLKIQTPLSTDTINFVYHDVLASENPIFIDCEDDDQIIVVDVYCNESWENAEYINPFWGQEKPEEASNYGGEDGNSEPRHIIASAKFRDLFSFTSYPGEHVIDWYSSLIVFFGSYTMQVMAIDNNYYNFININEYPELQSGVNGGIGVFGSACGETFQLYILKP